MLKELHHYLRESGIFLISAALIAGTVGCDGYTPPSEDLEIRTWYDLDDVRDNLAGHHTLMNDLDSTTAGYTELASPTANGGKGWQPIGSYTPSGPVAFIGFRGTLDGQGHEIHDLYINRPDQSYVGLFCETDGAIITDMGAVNITVIGEEAVGCLVAVNVDIVSNCYSIGEVTGNKYVGGLVGMTTAGSTVKSSYFSGTVTGNLQVGGLTGRDTGMVSNSYSTGSVTGVGDVGGLVGYAYGDRVSNSYSTCNVTGDFDAGGLVGRNEEDTVSSSFWDTETSGQATSAGGTGKNTTEMRDIATFLGAGWNITAVALNETNPAYIWNIVNNMTYPFLSWQAI